MDHLQALLEDYPKVIKQHLDIHLVLIQSHYVQLMLKLIINSINIIEN